MFNSPFFGAIMAYIMPALVSALGAAAVWALMKIAAYFKIQVTLHQQEQVRQAVADAVAYAEQMATKGRGMTGTEKKDMAIPIIEADLKKSGITLNEGVAGQKIESFLGQDKVPVTTLATPTVIVAPAPATPPNSLPPLG